MWTLPFREVTKETFTSLMKDARVNLITRARIWRRTDPVLQRHVYDELRETIHQQLSLASLDARRAFPEPSGMEQFRQEQAHSERKETPNTIEMQ